MQQPPRLQSIPPNWAPSFSSSVDAPKRRSTTKPRPALLLKSHHNFGWKSFDGPSWKWKITLNGRKLVLEGPVFHFHDYGRKGNKYWDLLFRTMLDTTIFNQCCQISVNTGVVRIVDLCFSFLKN